MDAFNYKVLQHIQHHDPRCDDPHHPADSWILCDQWLGVTGTSNAVVQSKERTILPSWWASGEATC